MSLAPWFPLSPAQVDALVAWLLTYLVHSTLLLAGAWLLARRLPRGLVRERLWSAALVGGLLTASLQAGLGTARGAQWTLAHEGPISVAADGATPVSERGAQPAGSGAQASTVAPLAGVGSPAVGAQPRLDLRRGLLVAWLVGALAGLARLLAARSRLARALRARRALRHGPAFESFAAVARAAGRTTTPRLFGVRGLASPFVRTDDSVFVPERALSDLGAPELEALFAHELAHLRRRDPLRRLGVAALCEVLFPQPLNRLAARRLEAEAEFACDELATRWTGGGLALARCLASVAEWMRPLPRRAAVPAMAVHESALVQRVRYLLEPAPARSSRLSTALLACATALGGGVVACKGPHVRSERPAASPEASVEEPPERSIVASIEAVPEEVFEEPPEEVEELTEEHAEYELDDVTDIFELTDVTNEATLDDVTDSAELAGMVDPSGRRGLAGPGDGGAWSHPSRPRTTHGADFEFHSDGSVEFDGRRLAGAAAATEVALERWLTLAAESMPTRAVPISGGRELVLPSGEFTIHAAPDVAMYRVQELMSRCGTSNVRIWRLRISTVLEGRPEPYVLDAPLPVDVGVAVEEGAEAPRTTAVGLDVRADARGVVEVRLDGESVADSAALRRRVAALDAAAPGRRFVVDCHAGVSVGKTLDVIEDVVLAGATDITFKGPRGPRR